MTRKNIEKKNDEPVVLDSLEVLAELEGFSSDGNNLKKRRWFRLS